MKNRISIGIAVLCLASVAMADSFGSGANQFEIDFVTISGATNPTSGHGIINNDYRMGVYEITNRQWDRFGESLGMPVVGNPQTAYDEAPFFDGEDVPVSAVSWYEAAQFVNYLNTSTGHQAAYNFTGSQGTSDYTFSLWSPAEADGGTNLYRHKDAFYFLPTEDEWVKAAYWNGTYLQTYATVDDSVPDRDGDSRYAAGNGYQMPWPVSVGTEELNGTYNMMGNIFEWTETPWFDGMMLRGGDFYSTIQFLMVTGANLNLPEQESGTLYSGIRVASKVPEPATVSLLALGGVTILKRRRAS